MPDLLERAETGAGRLMVTGIECGLPTPPSGWFLLDHGDRVELLKETESEHSVPVAGWLLGHVEPADLGYDWWWWYVGEGTDGFSDMEKGKYWAVLGLLSACQYQD